LPQDVVDANNINAFRKPLDKLIGKMSIRRYKTQKFTPTSGSRNTSSHILEGGEDIL